MEYSENKCRANDSNVELRRLLAELVVILEMKEMIESIQERKSYFGIDNTDSGPCTRFCVNAFSQK